MTELELQAYLDKWWGKKRLLIKDYIDSRLGIAKKSGKLFAPPTIDDIHQYLKEHNRQWADGNTAEKFISFYGAKGWMIGKNKMKDWDWPCAIIGLYKKKKYQINLLTNTASVVE